MHYLFLKLQSSRNDWRLIRTTCTMFAMMLCASTETTVCHNACVLLQTWKSPYQIIVGESPISDTKRKTIRVFRKVVFRILVRIVKSQIRLNIVWNLIYILYAISEGHDLTCVDAQLRFSLALIRLVDLFSQFRLGSDYAILQFSHVIFQISFTLTSNCTDW